MTSKEPTTKLDPRFSSSDASPTVWAVARAQLNQADVFWLSTVRSNGRPHVTPVLAVLLDDILYFCTGQHERKAKNLAHNAACTLTTGNNALNAQELDIVVEGEAVHVSDEELLQRIADKYVLKYGNEWHFTVHSGMFHNEAGHVAHVYAVAPKVAFGFNKGKSFSQTRWCF